MSRQQGFTLLEMVLVMVILVIGAGVAVPRFADFTGRQHLAAAASQATAVLAFARDYARSHGVAVMVTWDQSLVTVSVEADPEGAPGEFTPVHAGWESLLRLPAGVTVADLLQGEESLELPWEQVIYADGTGEDLAVVLQDEQGHTRRLDYRGRLGTALVQEEGEEAQDAGS